MKEPQFDTYLRAVLDRAEHEAQDDGSATIEAQHVLLAMAAQDGTDAKRVLDSAGLGYEAVKSALHREFVRSLSTVGVSLDAFDLPRATPDPSRRPQPGAWFRPAVERTAAAHGNGDLGSRHLLLGMLAAEAGTVPRALAVAGVDRASLIERARSEP
jgi:ATP-dependent Clp protease ATP-binding subunit ClpA